MEPSNSSSQDPGEEPYKPINIEDYHEIKLKPPTWNEGKCQKIYWYLPIKAETGYFNFKFLRKMILEEIEKNKQYMKAPLGLKENVCVLFILNLYPTIY
jgi:hypothetical protein